MKWLRAITVTGLAVTLVIGPSAFAQTQNSETAESGYSATPGQSSYGGNVQNGQTSLNGNVQSSLSSMDHHVRNDINQASDEGIDVSDASYFEQLGREALENRNLRDAMIDFTVADECLGPYGSMVQTAVNEESFPGNQRAKAKDLEREVVRDTNRALSNNADVREALVFENHGLQALQNGDQAKALKEFRAAEAALGPYASNAGNSGAAATGSEVSGSGNGQAWDQAHQVRSDIEQAQSQGIDVSDAQEFTSQARQALRNGDQDEAAHDFQDAEDALQQAGFQSAESKGGNIDINSGSGGNQWGWDQAHQLKHDIEQAEAQGFDVTDAKQFASQGRQELGNGDRKEAARDFRQAENALQQAGFSSAQNNGMNSETASSSNSGNQTGWEQAQQLRHDIDQAQAQGYNVNDAFYLESQGRLALQNGDQAKASRDFQKAEQLLSSDGYKSNASNQQAYNNQK